MEKKISEMTNKEILRRQLELLAEVSEREFVDKDISLAMCEIYKLLEVGISDMPAI